MWKIADICISWTENMKNIENKFELDKFSDLLNPLSMEIANIVISSPQIVRLISIIPGGK